jgi:Uma2 family endonuclease
VAHPAPNDPSRDPRFTVERYLALFEDGALDPHDRVELLEGVVVAMPPSNPPHAANLIGLSEVSVAVDDLLPGR